MLHIERLSIKSRNNIVAYLMIAPVTLGLLWLYIIPFFTNLFLSFAKIKAFGRGITYVGLKNFKDLFSDKLYWNSILNTSEYVIIIILVGLALSLFISALLNQNIRVKNLYRTLYFLPNITMSTVIAIIFLASFHQEFGIVNKIIRSLGGPTIDWFSNPLFAKILICIVVIWQSVGYNVILLLSGMQTIPRQYYEAANLEGASDLKVFFKITLPLLTPTLFFIIVMQMIGLFQLFDVVFLLAIYSNPVYDKVSTIGTYYYNLAFNLNNKGGASASTLFLFVIIFSITFLQFRLQKKWVNYDMV